MILYYPHLQMSLAEITGKTVLLIHALTGCMFRCYKCINYDEIIAKKHSNYHTIHQLNEVIKRQDKIIETIVFSGGEFLKAPISDLLDDLSVIKEAHNIPVIIYTTGYYLDKMQVLWEHKLVDGYHVDLKLPYHLLCEEDQNLITYTMGVPLTQNEINRLVQAIEWTVKTDIGYNQIRSVQYPFLDDSAFNECRLWIDKLNIKFNKQTPYRLHRFIDSSSNANMQND